MEAQQLKLPGFNQGDQLTIMNTISRKIRDENGKFSELLTLIYKDNVTGLKHKTEIVDPEYTFYVANPEARVAYNRLFIPSKDVYPVVSLHKEVDRNAAKEVGLKSWFSDCIQSGNRREAKKVHTHPDLFMSDVNLEDYYRFLFNKNYQNDTCAITKSYFDIEVDGLHQAGDFPEMGECPVNAITIIMQSTMQVYTLLLRTKENLEQITEFEEYMKHGGLNDLKQFVYNHVVSGRKLNPKIKEADWSLGVEKFNFNMVFYDEENELDLIADLFTLINRDKPDFVLAWNEAFDVPYLIARCRMLGADPALIMSHPDFSYKYADYFIDERVINEPAERCDFALISSYSVFLDQMIQFASRRKGQTKYLSFALDYIGTHIADVHKLDYKEITTNIAELPYKDYKTFVFYNVCDTIVQYCVEAITEDLDYVFGKSIVNNTRYSKVHRQTVYLANRGMKEFFDDGFIMGNNINKFNNPPTEKFLGAFVADPMKVSDYSRKKLNGRPANIFDNADDFDYKSLYPSIKTF